MCVFEDLDTPQEWDWEEEDDEEEGEEAQNVEAHTKGFWFISWFHEKGKTLINTSWPSRLQYIET